MGRGMIALVALFLTGCVHVSRQSYSGANSTSHSQTGSALQDSDRIVFRYRHEGGNAILDSDRVTLVFPDLPESELQTFHFQGGALPIQISGGGFSQATVNCQRNQFAANFNARYENGTNRIEFFGRRVELAKAATVVIVGDKLVDNPGGKVCVTVPR